jgi:hypothetical protein
MVEGICLVWRDRFYSMWMLEGGSSINKHCLLPSMLIDICCCAVVGCTWDSLLFVMHGYCL